MKKYMDIRVIQYSLVFRQSNHTYGPNSSKFYLNMFANFFCKLYLCNFCRICIFLLSYVCAEICLLGAIKASICRILHATARHPLMSALKPVDCYAPAIFTNTVAVQYKQHTKESKGNQETNVKLWIFLQTFNIIFKPFVINGRCALPDAIK